MYNHIRILSAIILSFREQSRVFENPTSDVYSSHSWDLNDFFFGSEKCVDAENG
jgi:hypothetical protein